MTDAVARRARHLRRALLVCAGVGLLAAAGLGLAWGLGWLAARPALAAAGGLAVLAAGVGLAAAAGRRAIWPPTAEAEAERRLEGALRRQHRAFEARARRIGPRRGQAPRVLFVTPIREGAQGPCSMAELGYSPFGSTVETGGLRLSTWVAQTGAAYRIEIGEGADLPDAALAYLLDRLRRARPERPLNALHVELDLARLGDDPEGTRQRRLTNGLASRAVAALGVDLPVHVSLVGLENARDLVRAAVLTGRLDDPAVLGGFLEAGDGADLPARIAALLGSMAAALEQARPAAMKAQLAADYCAALVAAPLQLHLLQAQLLPALEEVVRALPPRTRPLRLEGLFFLGTSPTRRAVDPLAQIVAQRFLGRTAAPGAPAPADEGAVTPRHAGRIARALYAEAYRAAPNPRALWLGRARGALVTAVLVALVGGQTVAALQDRATFAPLNADMEARFARYFDGVARIDPGADGLVPRVLLLGDLRAGLDRYGQADRPVLPHLGASWSQEAVYRSAYQAELTGGYLAALQDYIEKDLFAYNALSDGVSLFSLALTEVQFQTNAAQNAAALTDYFVAALAEEGQVEAAFTDAFRRTLSDLFALDPVPPGRNTDLNRVVARTLSGLDTAEMLYRRLLRDPALAQRIDLRALSGPRFAEVFAPVQPASAALVPRAFTREGFEQVFSPAQTRALRGMIEDYQALVGPMNASEINSLVRRVTDLYTAEYVATWSGFLAALRVRPADTWDEAQLLLAALADPFENPVLGLVAALRHHTALTAPPGPAGAEGAAEGDAPADGSAPARPAAADRAALRLAEAFRPYLAPATPGPEAPTAFDVLVLRAAEVNQWLQAAARAAEGPGRVLFETYRADAAATPLTALYRFAVTSELDLVRDVGVSLATTLDRAAAGFVADHVNAAWQRDVVLPHAEALATRFPFRGDSAADLSLATFAEVFGPTEGALRRFRETYLAPFAGPSGALRSGPGFLPVSTLLPTAEADAMFRAADRIGRTLFAEGRPALAFRLRAGFLDPDLSRLTLTSGVTLFQYSHGPVIWTDQSWPLSGLSDSRIRLRLYNRSRLVLQAEAQGPWAWFRLAEAGYRSINPALGLAEASFLDDAGAATLQLAAPSSANPFDPDFFASFRLAPAIFER